MPVNLPLSSQCVANSSSIEFEYDQSFGTVTASSNNGLWVEFSKISYHYYCIVGILVCLLVSHIVELFLRLFGKNPRRNVVNSIYLAACLRAKPPNIVIEAAESQCLSKNCSEN